MPALDIEFGRIAATIPVTDMPRASERAAGERVLVNTPAAAARATWTNAYSAVSWRSICSRWAASAAASAPGAGAGPS
jgi:hypothetical protein